MTMDLQRVAAVYNASSVRPAARVRSSFNVPKSTASRWIRLCRDRGLIAAEPREWRLHEAFEAVALDLGVTPGELARSILRHAPGGHLWVPTRWRSGEQS